MFSHVCVGSNDLPRARRFYDALFRAMGTEPGAQEDPACLVYARDGIALLVMTPVDGRPAAPANGGTIGFAPDSPAAVERWHAAGLAAGGTAIEDPPGPRRRPFGPLHLAHLRDPDGNKLAAVHRADG